MPPPWIMKPESITRWKTRAIVLTALDVLQKIVDGLWRECRIEFENDFAGAGLQCNIVGPGNEVRPPS
jgi:hypothetical protein